MVMVVIKDIAIFILFYFYFCQKMDVKNEAFHEFKNVIIYDSHSKQ